MDKKKLIYLSLGSLLIFPSCSQEGPAVHEIPGDGNRIFFRSYLPAVTETRAGVISSGNFITCQVTGFNPSDNKLIDPATGEISPYFSDTRFNKNDDGLFFSEGEDECLWPDSQSKLHFFAYYPAVEELKEVSGDGFFNLANASRVSDGKVLIDYRIKKFRIAKEIADQVDFLTAYSSASLSEDHGSGISLDFKHQLARVELSAWGANEKYDFEIAGVRIGNPLVEGDFNLSSLSEINGQTSLWENVSGQQAPVEHIFSAGETVVSLNKTSGAHASEGDAASIMGTAGPAMVIPMPARIEGWEGKNDSSITTTPYATDKLYFSVLLRVKNKDNKVAYPYPNDRDNMTVVYFAIDNTGKIMARLHKIDGVFYTTPEKDGNNIYTPKDSEEICGFGWAALPVAARWEAGKIYTYKLNYSNGIGWHDPADPYPGEPIIERGPVPFEISIEEWAQADDYNPNLDVPKR